MSCFKINTQTKNWDDAKAACQSVGDRLAVFDSFDSISWAKHMRKTHQGDVKHAKHEGLDFILFCWIKSIMKFEQLANAMFIVYKFISYNVVLLKIILGK